MKQRAWWLVFVSLGALQAPAEQGQGRIGGMVRSATTGEALKSAVVSLGSQAADERFSQITTTAPDGSFAFGGLPAGRYQLVIRKTGYQTLHGNATRTTLRDNQTGANLVFTLWPAATISGRVLDWEGEPVAEAPVNAYSVLYGERGVTLSLAGKANSDDLGAYRLFGLPAGRYVLQVWPPRAGTPAGEFYSQTAASFYPRVSAPSQALPLAVDWGQDLTDVELSLSESPTYAVGGAVWDAAMEGPCRRCFVRAAQRDGAFLLSLPQTARVSADGSFVLRGLAPGDYKLIAQRGSGEGLVSQASVVIRDRDLEGVGLVVGVQQQVSGVVVLEDPPDEVDATRWTPYLSSVELPRSWPDARGEVGSDLRFAVEDVPLATYAFELLELPPGAYLASLRVGGQALPRPELKVLESTALTGLQVRIAFDGSAVHGQVRPGRSDTDGQNGRARVFLIPRRNQRGYQRPKETETAADGSFGFVSVVPGAYTLYALPVVSSLQIFDPTVQSGLRSYARQVDLDPKESATVELHLAPERE